MPSHDAASRYARFARDEAPGRSPVYEEWARAVADSASACAVIDRLPANRRQPPLVFAVARMLGARPLPGVPFVEWLVRHADALVAEAARRSVQTNEPQRCAALVPALSLIEGPIALIEVGASAGLCLLPDRYAYRYRGAAEVDLDPSGGSSVVLECEVRDSSVRGRGVPALHLPEIVWRAGIDLAPLNAADPSDRAFLTTLVWPGETGREARISAALDVAAADRPTIVAGDATDAGALEALAARVPSGATLVVSTPGVLPHVPFAGRQRMRAAIRDVGARWVSLDPPGLEASAGEGVDGARWPGFVLGLDGHALAACDPLGGWLEWRNGSSRAAG
ncbi:MAG: DUF2332 domain-containing protein [Microbacterium sp.]|uniref:DUF2332 domain-containing protein n=1 Tax=Microbacterium sp. TaxID=51671 RepID=UPI000DB1AF6D|nr:DUF2332 domain-containing protein [Microbacterium sp.]PZU36695.1 MAG: DUF2332 domain-containing protein [Microbacterium sp.]